MAAPEISGSSPCTLTKMSMSGMDRATSATRSVPHVACGSVITTCPPNRRTSAAISSWSAATHTPSGSVARNAAS